MKPVCLRPAEKVILNHIKRLGYATEAQLVYWSSYHVSTVSRALSSLRDLRFVKHEKAVLPNIWKLSWSGSRVVDRGLAWGLRKPSWSVMAHTCHRNRCEILLREQEVGFRFSDKQDLYRLGLNPSHGEHAGIQNGKILFVLLDDYLMGSDRISKTISRPHATNKKYCGSDKKMRWGNEMSRFFIVSTDQDQLKKHHSWINDRGIEAKLLYMPPIWVF